MDAGSAEIADRYRRKVLVVLASSTAFGGLGIFAGITVASILAGRMLTSSLAGLPLAFFSLGMAGIVIPLSAMMFRSGRRTGLFMGYCAGAAGSGIAALSTVRENVWLLSAGMFLMGVMYGTALLSRYAAADVTSLSDRGRAIGLITWALVVGALVGPNLTEISGTWMRSLDLPALAGPYMISLVGAIIAAVIVMTLLRPDPLKVARRNSHTGAPGPASSTRQLLRYAEVRLALVSIALVQFVMVGVMTITALHTVEHGHSLGFAGLVISAHFAGMFGLSPIAGVVADRLGRRPAMAAGQTIVFGGSLVAALAPTHPAGLVAALALIGLGWNINLVGASALLTDSVPLNDRPKVQGAADFVNGAISVVGSLASGVLISSVGFHGLGMIGMASMLLPLASLRIVRPQQVPA